MWPRIAGGFAEASRSISGKGTPQCKSGVRHRWLACASTNKRENSASTGLVRTLKEFTMCFDRYFFRKTEFCLNFIFFLTCPLALLLKIGGLFCCIQNYPEEYEEPLLNQNKYKCINLIKIGRGSKKTDPNASPGKKVDKYKNNDRKEVKDTKYVMHMMKQSQISLQNLSKM